MAEKIDLEASKNADHQDRSFLAQPRVFLSIVLALVLYAFAPGSPEKVPAWMSKAITSSLFAKPIVFDGKGNDMSWDRTKNGRALPNGIYARGAQVLFQRAPDQRYYGHITLLR